jgi:CubicO group peptidase (beta-lactamase class C family)
MSLKKIVFAASILFLVPIQLFAQQALDTLSYLKNNPNVYAIVIDQNNKTIYKRFYNGYNEDTQFNDQSLTKGVTSLLIGIAIDKGYLKSVDEKLVDIFPELKNDTDKRKQQVTIRQVMNQASGLYHENLVRLDKYLKLTDPSGYVLKEPMVANPGKEWHYNNAASHLLSVILTRATHMDTKTFAKKYLFDPMGITSFDWAKMADGYYDGSGLLSIRIRSVDMLKIGTLILNGGKYANKQIVPASWINEIFNPGIFYNADWGFENSTYAFDFYHTTYKGTYITYGMGWGGQFLIIIPSLNAVVVINENIANATAVKQSVAFIHQVFPVIFAALNK